MAGVAVRQVTLPIRLWSGLELPALRTDDGRVFIPVKLLHFALTGSADDRGARARIQRDDVLSALACPLRVQTAGGAQEMICIERLGLGRLIDRMDTSRMRPELRPRVLQLQWEITHAAYRVLMGETGAGEQFVSIVPAEQLAGADPRGLSVRDDDVRRYLLALAERIGRIEIDRRSIQGLLLALASGEGIEGAPRRCPQCGYTFAED